MKIIDFKVKGNQVKFFLGSDNCTDYWGDDWDDRPYEHNAGSVYDEFVLGWFIKTFDYDDIVAEPCYNEYNSNYSKEDMKERKIPCICVIPKEFDNFEWGTSFKEMIGNDNAIKYYFGDIIDETIEDVHYTENYERERQCLKIITNADKEILDISIEMFAKGIKEYLVGKNYCRNNDKFKEISNKPSIDFEKYFIELLKINYQLYKPNVNISTILNSTTVNIVNIKNIPKDGAIYITYLDRYIYNIGDIKR